jgi:DNA-binding response OmpR family regulator
MATGGRETPILRSGGPGNDPSQGPSPTVFVSDPSAEAERIILALRASGYVVIDVPTSMLLARVAVQRPRLVLVDADTEGALESVERLRELPDADGIEVVFLGHAGRTLGGMEDALAHEASGFFDRPVDISELIRKVEALTRRPLHDSSSVRMGTPLPHSLPRPSPRPLPRPASAPPQKTTSELPTSSALEASRRVVSIQTPLSSKLEALLAEAEQRVGAQLALETNFPTPEEEIEAVLPAEILSALDAPLEEDESDLIGRSAEDDAHERVAIGPHHAADAAASETHGGEPAASTTGNPDPTRSASEMNPSAGALDRDDSGAPPSSWRDGSAPPPPTEYQRDPVRVTSSTLGSIALQANAVAKDAVAGQSTNSTRARGKATSRRAESVAPPAAQARPLPSVLSISDAPVALAKAIASRATGAFCVESDEGVRRAVLREGDLITAASGVDSESLLAFLGARGDLPRERVEQLTGKVPPFGRHAGAALVAYGHLRQDQLWPVLRAHAEWILGKAILVRSGTAHLEVELPGRLRGEPSVFGGSTGAEVMVEVIRRVIGPEDAVARLGGRAGRLGEGIHASLLSECALDATERDILARMLGATLGTILEAASSPDFASVLYAISLLGVIDVVRSVDGARRDSPTGESEIEALDEDAIRARIRGRLEIVHEGDYFAVLGIAPDATGYEVRRAFLSLRRAFEPSRVLSPRIADLADDVRKIASVLEEAYEILSDNARRERYRRAILATPEP